LPVLAATVSAATLGFAANPLLARPLASDTAAWELTPTLPVDPAPWTRVELERVLRERTARQKPNPDGLQQRPLPDHTLYFLLPKYDRRQ
jgi:hypothetical protein